MDAQAGDAALLVLRLVVGAVFVAHGWNHVCGGGRIEGTTRWFASLGMRPARLHAWFASITELVAGTMLILGVATPLAAAAVIGVMVVAWITNHAGNGFFIFRPGEGWEYVMVLTACGAALAGLGAGVWSLDGLFGWFQPPGWRWSLVGVGIGVLGAFGLLATTWRPDRDA